MPTAAPAARRATGGHLEVTAVVTEGAGRVLAAAVTTDQDPMARARLARSPWMTTEVAARLAKSSSPTVRRPLAQNPATPPTVLRRLARDRTDSVRRDALANPSCPWDTVAAAGPGDVEPLKHPDCPTELVSVAAADQDNYHRWQLAVAHRNLDPQLRRNLAATLSDYRGHQLLDNPALTHREAERLLVTGRGAATWRWSAHPNADPAWLAAVADERFDDPDQDVLAHIAQNPATPAATLLRIVTEHDHRSYALENPSCPSAALAAALDWAQPDALHWLGRVACHPNVTGELLARLDARCLTTDPYRPFRFALRHAVSGPHAVTLLALVPAWSGSLAELVEATAAASLPAR